MTKTTYHNMEIIHAHFVRVFRNRDGTEPSTRPSPAGSVGLLEREVPGARTEVATREHVLFVRTTGGSASGQFFLTDEACRTCDTGYHDGIRGWRLPRQKSLR